MLISKYHRTAYEYGNHVHICAETTTRTVDVNEQKDMVNSGVRDRKKRNLRPEVYSKVS
jgi:hypothetical protein